MHVNDLMELVESRRNPHLNPRIDPLDSFSMYARTPNMFVTYTELPKVGINPKSGYNTPIGIYSYPLSYVLERAYRIGSVFGAAPFASQNKFVHLFKQRSQKILDLASYTASDYLRDEKLIIRYFSQMVSYDEVTRAIEDHKYSDSWNNRDSRDGKRIWNLIYFLIKKFTTARETIESTRILFRVLGYDAVYDMEGRGIIHPNEPVQAVHFNIQTIELIDTFENKDIPSDRKEARRELIGASELVENIDTIDRKYRTTTTTIKQLSQSILNVNGYDERVFGMVNDFVESFTSYSEYLKDLYKVIKASEPKLLNMTSQEIEEILRLNIGNIEDISNVADVFGRNSHFRQHLNDFMSGYRQLLSGEYAAALRGIATMKKSSNDIFISVKLSSPENISDMIMRGLLDNDSITVNDAIRYGIDV